MAGTACSLPVIKVLQSLAPRPVGILKVLCVVLRSGGCFKTNRKSYKQFKQSGNGIRFTFQRAEPSCQVQDERKD